MQSATPVVRLVGHVLAWTYLVPMNDRVGVVDLLIAMLKP